MKGIVKSRVRQDVVQFALPAMVVFAAGLILCARDGYRGLLPVLWRLLRHPSEIPDLSLPQAAGLALLVIGLAIALTGVFTLRRFYLSTLVIREDHQLITHGVYRLTRNPIYLGVLLVCFGLPIYASSLWGAAAMALLIPIFLNRIRLEEGLLAEHFGETYSDYQAKTSKLIPFLY